MVKYKFSMEAKHKFQIGEKFIYHINKHLKAEAEIIDVIYELSYKENTLGEHQYLIEFADAMNKSDKKITRLMPRSTIARCLSLQ